MKRTQCTHLIKRREEEGNKKRIRKRKRRRRRRGKREREREGVQRSHGRAIRLGGENQRSVKLKDPKVREGKDEGKEGRKGGEKCKGKKYEYYTKTEG